MKTFFKKFFSILAIIGAVSITTNLISPENTTAIPIDQSNCDTIFLGLTPWNCGIPDINNENSLKAGIWQIAANIATDIAIIAAYLVIAYVIYGGYQYIFSGGDPGKVASGKKTLNQAFIGLAIVLSANIIVNTIRITLISSNVQLTDCVTGQCINPAELINRTINWFISISGIVAVVFVLYGGILYMTSAGDASKLAKAKDVIKYSLIGLAIVALSFTITAFMRSAITNANNTSMIQIITKGEIS